MKPKPRTKAEKLQLTPKERYYPEIPPAEIEACYIYEWAREMTRRSPRLLDLFNKWRAGFRGNKATPRLPEALKAYQEFSGIMRTFLPDFPFISGPWFPDTPWQGLEQKFRAILVKNVTERHHWNSVPIHLELFKFTQHLPPTENGWLPLPSNWEILREMEQGSFRINWTHREGPIKAAFARWLKKELADRKQSGLIEIEQPRRRRGSSWDRLNWLGALRQCEDYPRKELVESGTDKIKAGFSFYSQYRDLSHAAKKAHRLLNSFLSQVERI